jgi:hypothetical protein
MGGAGGSAGITTTVSSGGNLGISLTALAGGGGQGHDGGGAGGAASIAATLTTGGVLQGVGSVSNIAFFTADGGNAQFSDTAPGALGGAATINISATATAGGDISASVLGGPGGISNQAKGGAGGLANLSASLTSTSSVTINASATGGASGDSNGGDAGAGASARLTLFGGSSTSSADVSVLGRIVGGNGGNSALGGTAGGAGASISVINAVNGDTSGALFLSQSAVGGSGGGGGGTGGAAGNASSFLSKVSSSTGGLGLSSTASGGAGGAGFGLGRATGGGDATSLAQGTQTAHGPNGTGGLTVVGEAFGGSGGAASATVGGAGGNADNTATAVSFQADHGSVNVTSLAIGGGGGAGTKTGDGGTAISSSTGTGRGIGGSVTVLDTAIGGGGSRGGDAGSTATATFVPPIGLSPGLDAEATATGGAGAGSAGGDALANASALGALPVTAFATATATAGRGGAARAHAVATGGSGTVTATSKTSGVSAKASSPVHSTDAVETRAAVAAAAPNPSLGKGLQAFTFVTANPLNADARAALRGNPKVGSNFDVGGTSTVLGLVAMGAAYPLDGSGLASTLTASFGETIDLSQIARLQHLMIGLLDPVFTGTFQTFQFLVTENGGTVLDKTFTDPGSATAFFADHTLDLGSLVGQTGSIDLGFGFDFTAQHAGDSFSSELLFGNTTAGSGVPTVPEPATVYLLGLGLAALACLRILRATPRLYVRAFGGARNDLAFRIGMNAPVLGAALTANHNRGWPMSRICSPSAGWTSPTRRSGEGC